MTVYDNTRLLVDGARGSDLGISRAVYRIITAFSQAAESFAKWNNARITRKELSKLSDRQLEDIGLTRADIDSYSLRSNQF